MFRSRRNTKIHNYSRANACGFESIMSGGEDEQLVKQPAVQIDSEAEKNKIDGLLGDDMQSLLALRDQERQALAEVNQKTQVELLKQEINELRLARKTAEDSLTSGPSRQQKEFNFVRPSRSTEKDHGGAHKSVMSLQNTKLAAKEGPFVRKEVRDSSVSSTGSNESVFSLSSRDSKRGKPGKNTQSGIKEGSIEKVVSKQKYPQSELQYEHMWGWSGGKMDYFELTFGLFVAGELEIILGGHMLDMEEVTRRLNLLRITAYRSQYIEWNKLLHLHAAILRKIETGGGIVGFKF